MKAILFAISFLFISNAHAQFGRSSVPLICQQHSEGSAARQSCADGQARMYYDSGLYEAQLRVQQERNQRQPSSGLANTDPRDLAPKERTPCYVDPDQDHCQ